MIRATTAQQSAIRGVIGLVFMAMTLISMGLVVTFLTTNMVIAGLALCGAVYGAQRVTDESMDLIAAVFSWVVTLGLLALWSGVI